MSDYTWLTSDSELFLSREYVLPGLTIDERIKQMIHNAFVRILNMPEYYEEFLEGFKKGWYSPSTPEWTNFGNDRGLPISCFGSKLPDSISGMMFHAGEVAMMSKFGGGTAGEWSGVRGRGEEINNNGKSNGSVHFMGIIDKVVNVVSQGSTRRGSYASYISVDHKDIWEFLTIKDDGNPLQDINFGITIPKGWMESMLGVEDKNFDFDNLDPTKGDPKKRKIWARIIECRFLKGYPYIIFLDNVNKDLPEWYTKLGLEITQSQLCTEIFEVTSIEKSFTCCIGSMNAAKFDEWKDTNAVRLFTYFQDAVVTEFLEKLEAMRDSSDPVHRDDFFFMSKAYKFAKEHRSIGVGILGYHTYLQSKMIPFDSYEAGQINLEIFKTIQRETIEASKELAIKFGEPEMLKGTGRRHTTLQAVAPTKSTAFIMGQVSEGIEPVESNFYIKDRAKIKVSHKNPILKELLLERGEDTPETWQSIGEKGGSVQHLTCLTPEEKKVFRTFKEIGNTPVVNQAAQRQPYIDQGQSTNLRVAKGANPKPMNKLLIHAWQSGIKSLYYQINENAAQEFGREVVDNDNCAACVS